MVNKKSDLGDRAMLFISRHRLLCLACTVIQYVRIQFNSELGEEIEKAIDIFMGDKEIIRGGIRRKTILRILYSRFRNLVKPKEYFLYDFRSRNEYGRKDFVGIYRLFIFWRKLKSDEKWEIYEDKFETYKVYKKYYGREVLKIATENDLPAFNAFAERHRRFIIKPVDLSGGKGIHIAQVGSREETCAVFKEMCKNGDAVVEELIAQSSEMARFNPSSINTIRLVTYYYKNRLTKICAVLRMGRNGSEVDNASHGGIYAPIDMDNGIIYTYAKSYKGEKYAFHPDTGVQIVGASIPRWEELNKLIEELVTVVPEQKMIGWDMALTDKGWVVVEANIEAGSQDLVHDHGLREVMHDFYEAFYEKASDTFNWNGEK